MKFIKLFTVIAVAMSVSIQASAGERVYRSDTITVPASATAVTNLVVIPENPATDYKSIDRVVACMSSGTATGKVSFVLYDLDKTTTIDTSTDLTTAGAVYSAQPKYAFNYDQVVKSYVATSDVPLMVTSTNTVTVHQKYSARIMKVIATQNAASATATTYKFGIFAE